MSWRGMVGRESILYVLSDNVMGHLSLEDIELRILEHKILLTYSPASAFGGLEKRGAHIKDGISHWDANACTPVKPTHAGALIVSPETSRTGSLARCYVSKQAAKAPAPLVVGNEDIIVSTLQKGCLVGICPTKPERALVVLPLPDGCEMLPCSTATKGHAVRMEGAGGTMSSMCCPFYGRV
ncbi:hypothetical protein GRJ2_001579400 [Grus japonensis]|uniref:DDE-1 domain-containing protein n=1 Tax=Grus japonensis TaxID=30415 RepID=A0ABC9X0C7_GRUJA